jgi:hypothetical protein
MISRKEYATENSAPTVATAGMIHGLPIHGVIVAASSIISLDRNPLKNGIPAIDSAATVHDHKGDRHQVAQAAQAFDIACMCLMIHDACAHEQRGLEGGVVDDVEHRNHCRKGGANAQQHRDQAQMLTRWKRPAAPSDHP